MKILSIDPALNKVGYAFLGKDLGGNINILNSGIINSKSVGKLSNNLKSESSDILKIKNIILAVRSICEDIKISAVVIEETFVNINMKSSLSLALSRGALIGYFSLLEDIKIFHITPTEVKKIITGNGNADKEQILKMLKMLFPKYVKLQQIKEFDESDAIAIGLAFLMDKNRSI